MDDETVREYQGKKMDDATRHEIIEKCKQHKGKVKLGGSISYVQQIPWIQNKTIRDNILFGLPMDEDRYNNTIHLCELENDLDILPGGDLTEIGEKGINLSGGQKARVSLARAVYANKDIILMDDPISALDSNVKKSIFKNLFLDELKGKTRILVTHAVEFLEKVDRIIIMEKGRIKYNATYDDLQHSEEIQHIVETLSKVSVKEEDEEKKQIEELKEQVKEQKGPRKSFISAQGSKITTDENEEKIEVGWSIYSKFFLSNKTWIFYLIAIPLTILSSYSMIQNGIFLGKWIDVTHTKQYFWRYFVIVFLLSLAYASLITIVGLIVSMATLRMTKMLHYNMLERAANAPINLYFDKTPTGRILNRFSSDIDKLDNAIDK